MPISTTGRVRLAQCRRKRGVRHEARSCPPPRICGTVPTESACMPSKNLLGVEDARAFEPAAAGATDAGSVRRSDAGTGDKQRVVDQRTRPGSSFRVIDVNDVRHFLKRVERDARRQQNRRALERNVGSQAACSTAAKECDEKIEVFEKSEEIEIQQQRNRSSSRLPLRDIFGAADRLGDRRNPRRVEISDEDKKSPVPPAVKEIARDEQQHVLPPPPQGPVDENDDREEENVNWRIEEHGLIREAIVAWYLPTAALFSTF